MAVATLKAPLLGVRCLGKRANVDSFDISYWLSVITHRHSRRPFHFSLTKKIPPPLSHAASDRFSEAPVDVNYMFTGDLHTNASEFL